MSGTATLTDELLAMARVVLDSRPIVGAWTRAAALLARQALEEALGDLWRRLAPGVEEAPFRAQLICLRGSVDERELAARAEYLWWALSRACHHHPYELDPTADEVAGWTDEVATVVARLRDVPGHPGSAPAPP